MKPVTRIDLFTNIDDYIAFMEWAQTKNPQTKEDMIRLLEEYKQPDLIVEGHKEIVEHKLVQGLKKKKAVNG